MSAASLAYTQSGAGFPCVFLHGFCESKEIWRDFVDPLVDSFWIVTVDLPGFGESKDNTQYSSVEELAQQVAVLLDHLRIREAIIVAHSLGGYVALALAEKQPALIAGLCLFHSTAYADSDEKKQNRNKSADFIQQNGIPPFIENFVPPLFFKGRHNELQNEMERTRQICLQTPEETAIAVTKAMRDRPDRTHVLRDAAYPVLFIAGKNDEAVPLEKAKEQFFLPNHAIVQVLAQTGHMGLLEHPEETRQMVTKFTEMCLQLKHTASTAGEGQSA